MGNRPPGEILVPLDRTPASEAVLAPATAVARALNARLTLVHIVKPAGSLNPIGDDAVGPGEARAAELSWSEAADAALAATAQRLGSSGVAVESEVIVAADVADAIVERAHQGSVQMVAMTLRGGPTFRYRAVSSVAQSVILRARLPLLLARSAGDDAAPASGTLAPIVVPLDGSAVAERALAAAVPLASAAGGTIWLVGAVAPERDPRTANPAGSARRPDAPDSLRAYLEQRAAALRATGLPVELALRSGAAEDVILDLAAEHNAGLILMTTHGRSGEASLVPGSVTRAVARRTRRPLLLLGPQSAASAGEA